MPKCVIHIHIECSCVYCEYTIIWMRVQWVTSRYWKCRDNCLAEYPEYLADDLLSIHHQSPRENTVVASRLPRLWRDATQEIRTPGCRCFNFAFRKRTPSIQTLSIQISLQHHYYSSNIHLIQSYMHYIAIPRIPLTYPSVLCASQ